MAARLTDRQKKFQSTRPARGATVAWWETGRCYPFQSTRPARGATWWPFMQRWAIWNFNPRAPRGARHREVIVPPPQKVFQSTRPARGATELRDVVLLLVLFQSTRPARGATWHGHIIVHGSIFQSTRPARGATTLPAPFYILTAISIHAPREGRDRLELTRDPGYRDFNPRAPRGARQGYTPGGNENDDISIHAPREGRDRRLFPML